MAIWSAPHVCHCQRRRQARTHGVPGFQTRLLPGLPSEPSGIGSGGTAAIGEYPLRQSPRGTCFCRFGKCTFLSGESQTAWANVPGTGDSIAGALTGFWRPECVFLADAVMRCPPTWAGPSGVCDEGARSPRASTSNAVQPVGGLAVPSPDIPKPETTRRLMCGFPLFATQQVF